MVNAVIHNYILWCIIPTTWLQCAICFGLSTKKKHHQAKLGYQIKVIVWTTLIHVVHTITFISYYSFAWWWLFVLRPEHVARHIYTILYHKTRCDWQLSPFTLSVFITTGCLSQRYVLNEKKNHQLKYLRTHGKDNITMRNITWYDTAETTKNAVL
jgi:hypothetical protein